MTEDDVQIGEKKKQRAALQSEAARILAAASAQGRVLSADEDSHVLKLMGEVQALEEEIHRLARHHAEFRRTGQR